MAPSRFAALPTCSICQDDDAGLGHVLTLCGHAFHQLCIRQWDKAQRDLGRRMRCPTCNGDLKAPHREPNGRISRFITIHSLTEREIPQSSSSSSHPLGTSSGPSCALGLKSDVESLRHSLEAETRKVQQLESDGLRWAAEKGAMELHQQQQAKQIEKIQKEYARREQRMNQSIQSQKAQLDHSQLVFRAEKDTLRTQVKKMSDQCVQVTEDRDQLGQQLSQLRRENQELQSFLSEISTEKKKVEASLLEISTVSENRAREIRILKSINETLKHLKRDKAESKISSLGVVRAACPRRTTDNDSSRRIVMSTPKTNLNHSLRFQFGPGSSRKGKGSNIHSTGMVESGLGSSDLEIHEVDVEMHSQEVSAPQNSSNRLEISQGSTPNHVKATYRDVKSVSKRRVDAGENLISHSLFGPDTKSYPIPLLKSGSIKRTKTK